MNTPGKLFCLFLILIISTGCTTQQTEPPAETTLAPQAWIDAPLNGSILPLGEDYEVVFHIAHPGGVVSGELSINDGIFAQPANPNGSLSPATLRVNWTPPQPGTYTLKVRAQSAEGEWGGYDTAVVNVIDRTITLTPTATSTVTPTATLTITPTSTTTPTIIPMVTSSPTTVPLVDVTFTRRVSTTEFYYGNCNPSAVEVWAQVSNPTAVSSVLLFQKLAGGSWDGGTPMSSLGSGLFKITIAGNNVPYHEGVSRTMWVHQLVATSSSGAVVGRSPSYQDVFLNPCSTNLGPLRPFITTAPFFPVISPTPTFIIIK